MTQEQWDKVVRLAVARSSGGDTAAVMQQIRDLTSPIDEASVDAELAEIAECCRQEQIQALARQLEELQP